MRSAHLYSITTLPSWKLTVRQGEVSHYRNFVAAGYIYLFSHRSAIDVRIDAPLEG
jgi:hypothetical protein